MDTIKLKSVIESLLLANGEPLGIKRIAEMLELPNADVRQAVKDLMEDYELRQGGIRIVEIANGFQLRTPVENGAFVKMLNASKPFKFSRAALETLSIIAYRQPITRSDVEYLRGVDSGGVLKTLLEKHLVRILGKKDVPGRPIIYGTSPQFLELFGLKDLSQLPPLKEVGALEEETPLPLPEKQPMTELSPSKG